MIFTPEKPQRLMIDHLLTHEIAYCIVGMGIGKTASCLAAWKELKDRGMSKGVLVLAPLRVANLTWPMEVAQWDQFKKLRVANLRTPIGRGAFIAGIADIYVINYDSIPMLVKLVEKRGGSVPYDTIIYDESTKAKNPKSKRIDMLRKQVPAVPRRWALTGTPAPNSDLDLFPQVRLLDDGERLGRSFHQFKQSWFHPQNPMFEHSKWIINGDDAKARIQQRISDITITLRSSDWLTDVPDAVIEDIEIPMPEATMEAYLEFERELVLELKQSNVQITAANAAALVSKLLQYTSGALYDAERKMHAVHNLKLDALAKLYKAEKSPLLVAVAFRHEQERIRKRFPEARFFEDAKSAEMQKSLLVQWNRGEIPMLVAHPRSIGHGLNLQKGSHRMCWTTLTYSREDYEQFIARLWRRGQTNVVQVHRLMCPGTVDDMVASVLESKQQNERQLLDALIMLESMRDKKPVKLKPKPAPSWEF